MIFIHRVYPKDFERFIKRFGQLGHDGHLTPRKVSKLLLIGATAILIGAELPKNISLDAREVASGTVSHDDWRTSWGSYDRTTQGSKLLEVTIRNVSRLTGKVVVSVHFLSDGQEAGVATRTFDLQRELEVVARVPGPVTEMRTLNFEALRYKRREGTAPVSTWYILARAEENGRIIASRASSPPLQAELTRQIKAELIK